MDHSIVNYLDEKLKTHVSNLGMHLAYLGTDIKKTGDSVKDAVNTLSGKLENFSNASEKQSKSMYWLTWALVVASFLNVAAIIFQAYHN